MGRIRSIKPEFPQSESIGRLSREARLLFIQIWTLVDDSGRARGTSRMLASLLYPYDPDAPMLIESWLEELEREDHIRRYAAEGQTYLDVPKFLEHQKIDKPSKSKLPAFENVRESSPKPRELSATDRDQGRDQGKEGSGGESIAPQTILPMADLDPEEIPDGLSGMQYAGIALTLGGIEASPERGSPSLKRAVDDKLELLARDEACSKPEAVRRMGERMKRAGPQKWHLWLQDGGWKLRAMQGVSTEGWE